MAGEDGTLNTAPTQTTSAAPEATPSPSPADHSSAPPASAEPSGEPRESLLDAVQQAVEPRTWQNDGRADAGQGASPAPRATTGQTASDDDLPDEVTAEELARYHPKATKRVEKLLGERRQLRAEISRLRTLEPSAQTADQVTNYLRQNDIGRDDFLHTLEMAAAMRRGDFKTFYEGVIPYMRLAEEYLGIALPPDLQQRVREGHMTTQAAAAYSRERMDRAIAQSQQQRTQQQATSMQQQQQVARLADNVATTVNQWETRAAQSDPAFAQKRAAIRDTMWAVVRERGSPTSAEHALVIANEAYRRVNQHYNSWVPPRRPTSRSPSSTGRITGAAPEAKTLGDAVRIARETARA